MTGTAAVPVWLWIIACVLAGYGAFALVRDLLVICRDR